MPFAAITYSIFFPGAQFDMVRLGIGLYGISPIDNSIINNVNGEVGDTFFFGGFYQCVE